MKPAIGTCVAWMALCGVLPLQGQRPGEVSVPVKLRPAGRILSPVQAVLLTEGLVAEDSTHAELRWRAADALVRLGLETEDPELARDLGYRALDHARVAVALDPQSMDAHYWMAASAGLLADVEGGRTRIRMAEAAWSEAGWVLAVDSTHAGAHYLRGRLHAAVQRVNPFVRFMAEHLLGADAMGQASWDGAVHHLKAAAALESEIPMHHFELAMVYGDTGRPDDMRRELEATLQAAGSGRPEIDERYRGRARALLQPAG